MIPQSFIQELLTRVDVVDVVGKAVRLKKAGANWLGLCPFHGEKSPSFTVSPAKQFYHCFGCGAHGTALGFLIEHGGMGYRDAVAELARWVGLTVRDDAQGARARPRGSPDVLATLTSAARFYAARLREAPRAIDYLKGRGLSGEIAARFAIGYAPDAWRSLEAAVPDYAASVMVEAGLVIESDEATAPGGRARRYDRFRDRVMFPIRTARGQVIGFGGRVLGQGEPKYLNSPETTVFSKGSELYGVFEGRSAIREQGCVIVVEGYMDVVMLAQHGIGHAVATLGTATTPQHVQKLMRLADRVVFSFDGDAAGQRAAWRALEACLPHASDTKRIEFLVLPSGHDPDSLVRERGAEGFLELLGQTQSLSEWLLHGLALRNDLASAEGRARYQAEARPLLRTMPPIALRVQLLHALAARVGVRPEDVARYVDQDETAPPARPVAARVSEPGSASRAEPGASGRRGGQSGWRGAPRWGGRPDNRPPPVFMPRTVPDLQKLVRLVLAWHPALAQESWETDFLPAATVAWLARMARLPAGAGAQAVVADLQGDQPELAASLAAEMAQDRALLAELALDEARQELAGALQQLRAQAMRAEVEGLVAAGLQTDAQRSRYAELLARCKALTA